MNKIKSRPVWKLVIFAGIGWLLSAALIITFIFTNDPFPVKVIIWIFCGIFFIIASILLWGQLFHRVMIKDNRLTRYRFVFKKTIKFSEIDRIENKDGLFDIIVNQKRFATLSSDDKSTQQMLLVLEKHHVKIKWN